jgi:hypothetical protein
MTTNPMDFGPNLPKSCPQISISKNPQNQKYTINIGEAIYNDIDEKLLNKLNNFKKLFSQQLGGGTDETTLPVLPNDIICQILENLLVMDGEFNNGKKPASHSNTRPIKRLGQSLQGNFKYPHSSLANILKIAVQYLKILKIEQDKKTVPYLGSIIYLYLPKSKPIVVNLYTKPHFVVSIMIPDDEYVEIKFEQDDESIITERIINDVADFIENLENDEIYTYFLYRTFTNDPAFFDIAFKKFNIAAAIAELEMEDLDDAEENDIRKSHQYYIKAWDACVNTDCPISISSFPRNEELTNILFQLLQPKSSQVVPQYLPPTAPSDNERLALILENIQSLFRDNRLYYAKILADRQAARERQEADDDGAGNLAGGFRLSLPSEAPSVMQGRTPSVASKTSSPSHATPQPCKTSLRVMIGNRLHIIYKCSGSKINYIKQNKNYNKLPRGLGSKLFELKK